MYLFYCVYYEFIKYNNLTKLIELSISEVIEYAEINIGFEY